MTQRIVAAWNALTAVSLAFLAAKILVVAGISAPTVALAGALGVLGILAAVASLHLWRGTRLGAVLTLFLQGLQLLQVNTSPLIYFIGFPLAAIIGLDPDPHLHWLTIWRPRLTITLDSGAADPWIGVNLPALLAIVVAGMALRTSAHAPRLGANSSAGPDKGTPSIG